MACCLIESSSSAWHGIRNPFFGAVALSNNGWLPLLESRVCQCENSTDRNLILDHRPEAENVWIVGDGSGYGFKHGPVMGEMVADVGP